jgi:hypothetical protein
MSFKDNEDIKKDFGQVVVDTIVDTTNVRDQIRTFMAANGYNVDKCDICSVKQLESAILFKFVHWTVPTMMSEPYYRIEFVIEL